MTWILKEIVEQIGTAKPCGNPLYLECLDSAECTFLDLGYQRVKLKNLDFSDTIKVKKKLKFLIL